MDEALKHAAEHSDLAAVKAWLTLFDQLMQAEHIPGETRRRVLNRCLFGDPRGDVFAKASLAVEDAATAMDPEALGFRKGEWITSAEEAGWGPVPEKVVVQFAGAQFKPHKPVSEEVTVDDNPRFVLRAFTDSNAVRLASILCDLADERSTRTLSREHVAAVWTVRCPRHLHGSGKRNVNGRIREGLCYLKAARLVAVDGATITLLDLPLLAMSASNLPVVTDEHGVSRPPSQWPAQPAVPDRLQAVQQALTDKLTEENDRG